MMADTGRTAAERPRGETRHRAREAAVQMLYQWEVGRMSVEDVARTFWMHTPILDADVDGVTAEETEEPLPEHLQQFAAELATGVVRHLASLDPLIAEAAENWRIERMAILDRLILRLAVFEFLHQPVTPGRVIINEALELARTFSSDDAVGFINGILDGIRKAMDRQ